MDVNDDVGVLNKCGVWAFFASRLAPTMGLGAFGRDWSTARPSSLARQLPQGVEYIWQGLVGCETVIASRLAPTIGLRYIWQRLVGRQTVIASRASSYNRIGEH